MNKDALLATLIGFGIGLIITGAFLFGPNLLKSLPKMSFSFPSFSLPKPNNSPSPAPEPQQPLTDVTISAPLTETIADKDTVLVSGTAPSGTTIVIAGIRDDIVVVAGDNATFAGQISLIEGKNDIAVTGYINGKAMTNSIILYYTPESL